MQNKHKTEMTNFLEEQERMDNENRKKMEEMEDKYATELK